MLFHKVEYNQVIVFHSHQYLLVGAGAILAVGDLTTTDLPFAGIGTLVIIFPDSFIT